MVAGQWEVRFTPGRATLDTKKWIDAQTRIILVRYPIRILISLAVFMKIAFQSETYLSLEHFRIAII